MIKVSVIVPIYNAEKYLWQCLDSVVGQSLREIEIILIDDGSSDHSSEICKEYLTDFRVSYFRKENEGLAAARADGMSHATGEYVGFVDSDDWLEADMFEKMYRAAKDNKADIVFCNCIENEDGHRFSPEMRSGNYNRGQIEDEILPRTLAYIGKRGEKRAIRWSNCLRIYKRDFLKENNISFDRRLRRSQDLHFTYLATLYANSYVYLGEEYLYHNRVVGGSLSRGYTKNMWLLYVMLINDLYAITEEYQDEQMMEQMHLRCFFFVTDCIENEMKPLCPNSRDERINKIEEIVNDPLCDRFYGHIPVEKLNPLLQTYYRLICEKKPKEIIEYTQRYRKREYLKRKYWKPFVAEMTEAPVIGTIYKAIRRK